LHDLLNKSERLALNVRAAKLRPPDVAAAVGSGGKLKRQSKKRMKRGDSRVSCSDENSETDSEAEEEFDIEGEDEVAPSASEDLLRSQPTASDATCIEIHGNPHRQLQSAKDLLWLIWAVSRPERISPAKTSTPA
jgi:hypothetical protein